MGEQRLRWPLRDPQIGRSLPYWASLQGASPQGLALSLGRGFLVERCGPRAAALRALAR